MEAYERAKLLLRRNVEVLHKMAEALLEREVIDGAEIDEILRQFGNQNGGLRGAATAASA
jgi:ATP-dependent Zn protease